MKAIRARILARQLARPLTSEEIDFVAGGMRAAAAAPVLLAPAALRIATTDHRCGSVGVLGTPTANAPVSPP